MKLIFFGGSFNPPHKGHYEIIRKCINKCHKLLIIPTLTSPFKETKTNLSSHHILKMLDMLITDIDHIIEIDQFDYKRSGQSFTIDTILYLKDKYPEYSISMIVGADQLINFKMWKKYDEIIRLVDIIGFNRKGYNFKPSANIRFTWLSDFNINISSKKIRSDIKIGKLNGNDLTTLIKNYILKNNLYGNS